MQHAFPNLSWIVSRFEKNSGVVGTFREVVTLKLREGILAKVLSPPWEASSLPPWSSVASIHSTVLPAIRPQDYGGFVADPRMVEIVDKALSKD